MMTIALEGQLGEYFVSEFIADVSSVAEAIKALVSNFPGFQQFLARSESEGIYYRIRVGNQVLDSDRQLTAPITQKVKRITITPVAAGSGGFGKIFLGVAFLALGLTGVGFLGISATTLALTGGAMILSGIAGLFGKTDSPENDEAKGKKSLVFGSPTTTLKQGGRIPIAYGYKLLVGHYVVSAQVRSHITEDDDD